MKRIIFFLFLFLVFPFIISAQSTAKEWYEKGMGLKDKDDYAGALEAFKNAITKKADYTEAYYEAGWCCNEMENYDDAVDFLKKCNPTSANDKKNAYNELAYSYYRLEKSAEAIETYQKTLALFPDNGTALRGMGTVYYEIEEDYDKAITYYEKAIEKDEEKSKPVYYNLGWLYNDKERYDDAIKILLKANEYDSENANNREELGYAYYMKGNYEYAMTQLNKAIELDPESQLGYFYKGLCFVATKKKGEAMGAYYKLKELNSNHAASLLEKINAMQ